MQAGHGGGTHDSCAALAGSQGSWLHTRLLLTQLVPARALRWLGTTSVMLRQLSAPQESCSWLMAFLMLALKVLSWSCGHEAGAQVSTVPAGRPGLSNEGMFRAAARAQGVRHATAPAAGSGAASACMRLAAARGGRGAGCECCMRHHCHQRHTLTPLCRSLLPSPLPPLTWVRSFSMALCAAPTMLCTSHTR